VVHDQEHDQEAVAGSRSIESTGALFVDAFVQQPVPHTSRRGPRVDRATGLHIKITNLDDSPD
jgi:hypothetical protein